MRRRLSRDEAQLWARVAQTVKPIAGRMPIVLEASPSAAAAAKPKQAPPPAPRKPAARSNLAAAQPVPVPPPAPRPLDRHGLDAGWDKRLARGLIAPDYTLDLHGHSLDAAYARLELGLGQALSLGARVVLVITGRPRPAPAADRGERRGAIRAKLLDWLAHGAYAASIAAVRTAHRRHGGAGAVYVVLRRPR